MSRFLASLNFDQLTSRQRGQQRDVLVRAGVDTVETEGAVHVACFAWLKELQFASTLLVVSLNAVMRLTRAANGEVANTHFERRNQRLNKLILTDGAYVLAEARTFKKTINNNRGCEVTYHQHGRVTRALPQAERFVSPEEEQEQRDRDPFRT